MKKFTEDEKVIAKNIDKTYKWIARNSNGCLGVYRNKPKKTAYAFNAQHFYEYHQLFIFGHMFKSIKWEDKEPTRIIDIYDPQILNDVEREYLKTILKPFHEDVNYVAKFGDCPKGDGTYDKEYLNISLRDGRLLFPDFDPGKMYAGMEQGKKYTLEELGITYAEEMQNE